MVVRAAESLSVFEIQLLVNPNILCWCIFDVLTLLRCPGVVANSRPNTAAYAIIPTATVAIVQLATVFVLVTFGSIVRLRICPIKEVGSSAISPHKVPFRSNSALAPDVCLTSPAGSRQIGVVLAVV